MPSLRDSRRILRLPGTDVPGYRLCRPYGTGSLGLLVGWFWPVESWACGPPKVMKNGSCSATTVPGSTALPFVISTEVERSAV